MPYMPVDFLPLLTLIIKICFDSTGTYMYTYKHVITYIYILIKVNIWQLVQKVWFHEIGPYTLQYNFTIFLGRWLPICIISKRDCCIFSHGLLLTRMHVYFTFIPTACVHAFQFVNTHNNNNSTYPSFKIVLWLLIKLHELMGSLHQSRARTQLYGLFISINASICMSHMVT